MSAVLRRPAGELIAGVVLVTIGRSLVSVLVRTGPSGDPARTAPAEISYSQTWARSYDDTTCTDFVGAMTEPQRVAAGADLLVAARLKGDTVEMPTDALIAEFTSRLRDARPIAPAASLAAAATGLYTANGSTSAVDPARANEA